jgi:hypothetical protein
VIIQLGQFSVAPKFSTTPNPLENHKVQDIETPCVGYGSQGV